MNELLRYLRNKDFSWLVTVSGLLAFLQLLGWGIIRDIFFKGRVLGIIDLPFWIIFWLTLSLISFAYIWKDEKYGKSLNSSRKKRIRDQMTVTLGIIYLVFFFGAMVIGVVVILLADSVSVSQ